MKIISKAGPVTTAALLAAGITVMVWFFGLKVFWRPISFLFSGKIFSDRAIVTGGALDQPSLQKGYFIFCAISIASGLLVFIIRWIADRRQWKVRRVLCACALLAFLQPLSVLTITFYDLIRYIHAMGFTERRVAGLMFGLGGYFGVFGFIAWASGMVRLRYPWGATERRGFEVLNGAERGASPAAK